jgi:uncharacterized RDD family membrane protein YckC
VGAGAGAAQGGAGVSYVPSPAGFWKRYVAYFVDVLLLSIVVNVVVSMAMTALSFGLPSIEAIAREGAGDPMAALQKLWPIVLWSTVGSLVLYVVLAGAYFIGMEASSKQASFGKQLVGIRVTDRDGNPPGFGRAAGRFFAATLSWLTLNLGHALAAWTKERRALHDYLAGTRVENADPAKTAMPTWGWIVIAANVLALVGTVLLTVGIAWFIVMQTQAFRF